MRRKTLLTLVAALAVAPALTAPPAAAQTRAQTFALGPSDFIGGYAETGRPERRWASDPALYGERDMRRRAVRSRDVDCGSYALRNDPRCFVR